MSQLPSSDDSSLDDEFDEEEYKDDYDEERLDVESMDIYQLLEVAVDLDTEDADRIVVIEKLIELGSSSAAAIQWLMHSRYLRHLHGLHQSEVNDLLTGLPVNAEDQVAGLQIVMENTRLSDIDRAWAFAKSLDDGPERAASYRQHMPLIPFQNLIFGLEEMITDGDSLLAVNAVREIAADRSLTNKERVRSATVLTDDANFREDAVNVLRELLQDPTLVDPAARKDAEEWVNVLDD
ncbi:hypothetical protein AB0C10_29535 [Microbispora amethystogenes]|uniref:hypothetical protein n=1 Tax=Microbispora amethystogenes TaxID=1427754 RepID=UPI0033DF9292